MVAMDGVIKYGSGKADWNTARSAIMPVTELAVALNGEASFAIVCRMQSDEFVVGGDFVKHERALARWRQDVHDGNNDSEANRDRQQHGSNDSTLWHPGGPG